MAGEAQDNVWPLPSFYFKVELGSLGEIAFKRGIWSGYGSPSN